MPPKSKPEQKRRFPWKTALGTAGVVGGLGGAALLKYYYDKGQKQSFLTHVLHELKNAQAEAVRTGDIRSANALNGLMNHTRKNGVSDSVLTHMQYYRQHFESNGDPRDVQHLIVPGMMPIDAMDPIEAASNVAAQDA